ncbi:MAG: hypothetical protein ACREU4_08560 [Burkholderiales bacterium]
MARAKRASKKNSTRKMYESVIKHVFDGNYAKGASSVNFTRQDVENAAKKLGLDPKNVGDVIYSYRYRRDLPAEIAGRARKGEVWIIRGTGAARYRFDSVPVDYAYINPRSGLAETRIPDATPGAIAMYALDDEQALLARVRYNRLIDIFLGVASYALQSHLRPQVEDVGQVETDEVYVGIDRQGAHYVFPVQAKGGDDRHSIVQIEQDIAMCKAKFPSCICRPVAAQFIGGEKIALFSFHEARGGEAKILAERHYVLVDPDQLSKDDLESYRKLASRGGGI